MTMPVKYAPEADIREIYPRIKEPYVLPVRYSPWTTYKYGLSTMDVNAFANILHVSCSYDREDALIGNVYR